MSIISSVLDIRSRHGYRHKYRKKLPSILFMLLILMPTHSGYAKDKKCIEHKYQYEDMLYDVISKRIKEPRPSGECSIMFDIDLHKALIVGKVMYTDTPLCSHIIPIFSDVYKNKLAECYIESGIVTRDGRWGYVLVFGDGKH